jgi:hypothetical protein
MPRCFWGMVAGNCAFRCENINRNPRITVDNS